MWESFSDHEAKTIVELQQSFGWTADVFVLSGSSPVWALFYRTRKKLLSHSWDCVQSSLYFKIEELYSSVHADKFKKIERAIWKDI